MQRVLAVAFVLLLLEGQAQAQPTAFASEDEIENQIERAPPNISPDLLDRTGRSRFHLTGRATFDDGVSAFSGSSVWATEAQAALRITRGLALTFNLPFGVTAPSPGVNNFFFGNFRVGVAGGSSFVVLPSNEGRGAGTLGFGGAFDVYAPTAPEVGDLECPGQGFCAPVSQVRGIRSYEPFLYFEKLMSFRARGQVDFALDPFSAQLELGLTPGFTTRSEVDFFMFFSWALRARAFPIYEVEPFLEIGSNLQIAGPNVQIAGGSIDASTPVHLTFGGRFHFGTLDPALFATLDLKNGIFIFGVDLAGAVREVANTSSAPDPLDF
ncbi:MAG: hypothetical protein IPG45_10180 [Deltaproteobacteria bacterium]|jgi:hypothetical protein|nr:hypothetical protein [Deltaproteobacteria bacterium]